MPSESSTQAQKTTKADTDADATKRVSPTWGGVFVTDGQGSGRMPYDIETQRVLPKGSILKSLDITTEENEAIAAKWPAMKK